MNRFYVLDWPDVRYYESIEDLEKFTAASRVLGVFDKIMKIMYDSKPALTGEEAWSIYLKINMQNTKVVNPIYLIETKTTKDNREAWLVIVNEKIGWIYLGYEDDDFVRPFTF
jgi:hypothetical protein